LKEKTKKINSEFVWKQYLKNTTSKDPLNKILEAELKTYLPDQVLAFVDRLSMAHSIELRTPFLDYRLVELTATIPGGMKIKNGAVKYILKKAVKDLLPQEIIDRPKEGFVLPINTWLHKNMQKYVEKTLNSGQLRKHGFFDENVVKTLVKCYYNQTAKNLYEFNELSNKIWLLVIFQLWWKKYFL
jgi:asparagine synthase (glutamine-hydrolysing)